MSIRKRVLTSILVTSVVLIVVLYVISRLIILTGFRNVETVMVKRDVKQVLSALHAEGASLCATSREWLARTSTRQFLHTLQQKTIDEQSLPKAFPDPELDAVLIFDPEAKPLFGVLNSRTEQHTFKTLQQLQQIFVGHPNLLHHRTATGTETGILLLSDGPLLFCSLPIVAGSPEGSVTSTLITGLRINRRRSRMISRALHLNIVFWNPRDPDLASALGAMDLDQADPVSVHAVEDDLIRGFGVLLDPFGKPALIVEVHSRRDFYHVGLATANYFVFCLVMVGIVFGAVSWQTMELSVLSRLTRLTGDVTDIAGQATPRKRVRSDGSDELTVLADGINSMLTALEGSEDALSESERRYRAVVHDQTEAIGRFLPDGTLTFANEAFCALLGKNRDQVVGQSFFDTFDEDERKNVIRLLEGLDRHRLVSSHESTVRPAHGDMRWYQWTERAIVDSHGVVAEYQAVGHDVTARKQAEDALQESKDGLERTVEERTARLVEINEKLREEIEHRERTQEHLEASAQEKEVLLQEIHHRVKNNLQIMVSLLDLQSQYVEDVRCLEVLSDAEHRIISMALVHEQLYQSDNLAEIEIHDYLQNLVEDLLYSSETLEERVTLVVDVERLALGIGTALPLGLLINELVTNSLKHAFGEDRKGEIKISLKALDEDAFELQVADNGVGFPSGVDWHSGDSFGLFLVRSLVDQLHGEMKLDTTEGTAFLMRLRKVRERKKHGADG